MSLVLALTILCALIMVGMNGMTYMPACPACGGTKEHSTDCPWRDRESGTR